MQKAKFSRTLVEQIHSFNTLGYVLIKKSMGNGEKAELEAAKEYILHRFARKQDTWTYKLWRMFNKVSTADKRHSLVLPSDMIILNVLNSTIGRIRPFLNSQLSGDASMVELNSLISLPGSLQQDVHADIPYSDDNLLISGYIALSEVALEDGPTCLHAGSHTQAFHKSIRTKPLDTHYSSDGSVDDEMYAGFSTGREGKITNEESAEAVQSPPSYALLQAGDILLFNTMVFHYGSANTSALPRALLSFSFQRCSTTSGNMEPINGFTYHCHNSVAGKFTLNNFPSTASMSHS